MTQADAAPEPETFRGSLTGPQRDALQILAALPEGSTCGAWRRSSRGGEYPAINIRAGNALVQAKLATVTYPPSYLRSPYVNRDRYAATALGRQVAALPTQRPT